jgi:hypothetical protein
MHVAILFLDRNQGILDRRLGRARCHDDGIWRRMAVRELFPASEASWRIPTLLMFSGSGMAAGGWLAGLLYDHFGYYAPAFAAGIVINAVQFTVIGILVWRHQRPTLATA